jgi:hypothetical protein
LLEHVASSASCRSASFVAAASAAAASEEEEGEEGEEEEEEEEGEEEEEAATATPPSSPPPPPSWSPPSCVMRKFDFVFFTFFDFLPPFFPWRRIRSSRRVLGVGLIQPICSFWQKEGSEECKQRTKTAGKQQTETTIEKKRSKDGMKVRWERKGGREKITNP